MSPQDPQNAALVAHIVSQIEQNVNLLVSQNHISNSDASAILNRLPKNDLATRVANLDIGNRNIPPPAVPRQVPAPAARSRALWAYNENGQVIPNYPSFITHSSHQGPSTLIGPQRPDFRCGRYNRNRRRNQR
jgi:LAS seventeen-binding protein 1/2